MDSLTHLILGAAIGEAVLGRKIGRKAMLWGALADTIPDFDVFAEPCYTEAQQLLVHRGITHSFFFITIASVLLGWLWSKWFKRSGVEMKSWTWLFFLGMLTHILLDSLTAYGTGWFEPFSSYRVSFNTIFVADPLYTLPFLICLLVALIARNGSPVRRKWNAAGLWISSLYLVFTIFNHNHVESVMKDSFARQNLKADEFTVTPTALNNFLWMAYTRDSSGAHIGYYSIFDKSKDISYYHLQRKDRLLEPYLGDRSVQLLKQFSKDNYIITTQDSGIYFNDLRFGQIGGWDGPDSAFVFTYRVDQQGGAKALDRGRFKGSMKEAFTALAERAAGR
jgi:inner membrane protein